MQRVLAQLAEIEQCEGKSRREILDDIVTPLQEGVTRIHLEHHRAFIAAMRALPRRTAEGQWVSAAGIGLDGAQLEDVVEGVREAVMLQSQDHETIRQKVRADAGDLLRCVEDPATKRYLLSVIHYFLGEHYVAPSADVMDMLAHEIESRGGLRAVHTSVSRLIMQLDASSDADHIRNALQDAVVSLNEGYTEVCAWHAILRRDVMNEGKTERREPR